MSEPRPLHRLFGLSWMDFLQGSDIGVEMEMDLSLKQQFLDLVLRKGAVPFTRPLPDGFEELAPHNLMTFKSHQEALDGNALCELIGHQVNYRKQVSPSMQDLLPESDFRLFAVCVRFPQNLARHGILQPVRPGVYDAVFPGLVTFRVIVVHQLPKEQQNAMLHLFSAREDLLQYGKEHYRPRSTETSTLLLQLFRAYQEDPDMATQLEEYVRKSLDEILGQLPAEELRKRLSHEERLEGMTPEERLKGLSLRERLKGLSPEEVRAALEEVQRECGGNGSSSTPN